MRGKGLRCCIKVASGGITPAHAGKRNGITMADLKDKDHPRACGEKPPLTCACTCVMGSPPRMRGKDDDNVDVSDKVGITPAHAGKSKN